VHRTAYIPCKYNSLPAFFSKHHKHLIALTTPIRFRPGLSPMFIPSYCAVRCPTLPRTRELTSDAVAIYTDPSNICKKTLFRPIIVVGNGCLSLLMQLLGGRWGFCLIAVPSRLFPMGPFGRRRYQHYLWYLVHVFLLQFPIVILRRFINRLTGEQSADAQRRSLE
jgi:hypothetical protein